MTAAVEPRASSQLGRGALVITIATAASRVTGFVRVVVVASVMGATYLANTYNTANAAPNLAFELMAAGILTSVLVPAFVRQLSQTSGSRSWEAANALTSVAMIVLTVIALVVALAAPAIMSLLLTATDPAVKQDAIALGTDLLRLFAPQIVLYGAGMIMTAALHAQRRFTMAALAPIFNNVVVIGVYLSYGAMRGDRPPSVSTITPGETLLLGAGTTLGVAAMTVCLIPSLRKLGWRFRLMFQPRHPAVREGARVGVWAIGYAGGYQAGLIVVMILANRIEGGVAAYQWAFTFFFLPHALFGAAIFNVLFTAMSEHAIRGETGDLVRRLRDGLRMLAFVLLPVAAALVALARPVSDLTVGYGVMDTEGVDLVASTLAALALGLPTYSAYMILTRAFYARGDARTPAFLNAATVGASVVIGSTLFALADDHLKVAALALGHSIGFALGCGGMGRSFARRSGETVFGPSELRPFTLYLGLACLAGVVMWPISSVAPGHDLVGVLLAGGCGVLVYLLGAWWARAPEVERLRTLFVGVLRPRT